MNMNSSWVIGVLSTDYDLHDYREAAITLLNECKVGVSAFELPDFPVEPEVHSHEACLIALERVDIAILIIDKRSGGIFYNESDVTITEKEFFSLVKSKKPYLVFVSDNAWNERHIYKTALSQSGLSKNEFDKTYSCSYVQKIATIDFIENIENIYKDYQTSNWITIYKGIPDLKEKILGKLKGLTRYYCEKIIKEQENNLKKRHTSTSLSMSLEDVFSRGYYLEPSYKVESGKLSSTGSLDKKIVNALKNNNSVLVFGEAGYGKTTILAKSFLTHVEEFVEEKDFKMPFYLGLKSKGGSYHFDVNKYICECFEEDLNKEFYPLFDYGFITPYFYLDGFDEISEKMTSTEVEAISKADMFRSPVLLTCRLQYAHRYISNFNFSDIFGTRVEIDTWNPDKANEYIANFFTIQDKADQIPKIEALLSNNAALKEILNNPLLITMLLWVIEQKRMTIPETIQSRVELFEECIQELAKRELSRPHNHTLTEEQVVVVWSYAAWEVYYAKIMKRRTFLRELIEKLNNKLPSIPADYKVVLFEALFDSNKDEVFGTFHEQFLEYLVANTIYLACIKKSYPYPEFLNYVMRPEINRYFRAKWLKGSPEQMNVIVENLCLQYNQNLLHDKFENISKRVHAVYHITRFSTDKRNEFIEGAFRIEKHTSVLLSLYFGAIKLGRLDDEERFYNLLTKSSDFSDANRGYHLAYYSDAIMGEQLPYKDDIEIDWVGTLRAFVRHFESKNREHYFLRRIDLTTVLQFMDARQKTEPLSKETLERLEYLVNNPSVTDFPEFQSKIEDAFIAVRNAWKKYSLLT